MDVLGQREIFLKDGTLEVVMEPLEGKMLLQDVDYNS